MTRSSVIRLAGSASRSIRRAPARLPSAIATDSTTPAAGVVSPAVTGGQSGYLLGERPAGASGLVTEQPADRQDERRLPPADAGVGQMPRVSAVHPRRCPATVRTANLVRARPCLDPDPDALEVDPVRLQPGQMR